MDGLVPTGSHLFRVLHADTHADAGPAADTGEYANVLLTFVQPGIDVADDARRGLVAEELAARVSVDGL